MPSQTPEDGPLPPFFPLLLALMATQRLASLQIQAAQIRKVEAEAKIAEARARKESAWWIMALAAVWLRIARHPVGVLLLLELLLVASQR